MRLTVDQLSFTYPGRDRAAVQATSLEIEDGEFFSLLGPSGCGKTTLLWLLAGFLEPDSGRICFDQKDVTATTPETRQIGMVFQNYALFPHMTVGENVAFGLKARKQSPAEQAAGVKEALALVDLSHFESHRPGELSGGQQQRVALARALAPKPDLLLLDEPLSNLDAALRLSTRSRIRKLQSRLGITTVYVTHDQEEAMAISDRLAVMRDGQILQCGSPEQLYEQPDHSFAAAFLGRCNLFPATVNGEGQVICLGQSLGPVAQAEGVAAETGSDLWLMLRPEWGRIGGDADPAACLRIPATVTASEYLGGRRLLTLQAGGEGTSFELILDGRLENHAAIGDTVSIAFDLNRARLLPRESESKVSDPNDVPLSLDPAGEGRG